MRQKLPRGEELHSRLLWTFVIPKPDWKERDHGLRIRQDRKASIIALERFDESFADPIHSGERSGVKQKRRPTEVSISRVSLAGRCHEPTARWLIARRSSVQAE